ncbi:HAD family hydrolase [Candidatus Anaplasma sp. TIGMIC]|uniref:HAD family hydrolase n=1 Tax=Candidatus Anaplasma sp. TIGMIC TaxID=3020713 RepID=UPI00232C830D|nr:HAD-IA family hydrolase [Candidatus Anaplasma sp. TIGMIC]MDB1135543.1 HAD-IA family hydrolase [Candidatus Anaplasma sp. TIGMIC]
MFDWCNTIVKVGKADLGILRRVLHAMGAQNVELSSIPNVNISRYLAVHLGDRSVEAMRLYERISRQQKKRTLEINENVRELLKFLESNNISTGIVSNKPGKHLRNEVRSLGLEKHFSVILGAGDTPENKPSPTPIFAALDILGVEPSKRVFFVGDSDSDIESAKRANCLPIAFDNSSAKGVLSFSNFHDFGNFVDNLLN